MAQIVQTSQGALVVPGGGIYKPKPLTVAQIQALKPGSDEENHAVKNFAWMNAGRKLGFSPSYGRHKGTSKEGLVAGYYRAGVDGRWVVGFHIEGLHDEKSWTSADFRKFSGELFIAETHINAFGVHLGDVDVTAFQAPKSSRFPHTCKRCGKACYEGAYDFEHEANGRRECP